MNKPFDIYVASCAVDGGIYHYNIDGEKVYLTEKTELDRPMFLSKHNGKMYVVLREMEKDGNSGVYAYDIKEDGSLENCKYIGSTEGKCGCYLDANDDGVYVVNYISGSVSKVTKKLVTHSGKGPNEIRQEGPHTHFVCKTPDDKYILVTDLGLDRIYVYDKDLNEVTYAKVPAGHGARHLVFSDDGKILYCANEIGSTISVFSYDDGKIELKTTVNALPDDFKGENTAAAIRIKDNMLYMSNRGHDSIACFEMNGYDLILKDIVPCGGKHPRDFNIFGNLILCTNMHSNDITFFEIDGTTLKLLDTKINVNSPLCII